MRLPAVGHVSLGWALPRPKATSHDGVGISASLAVVQLAARWEPSSRTRFQQEWWRPLSFATTTTANSNGRAGDGGGSKASGDGNVGGLFGVGGGVGGCGCGGVHTCWRLPHGGDPRFGMGRNKS